MAKSKDITKKKYIANYPIKIDGVKVKPGEIVEIEEGHGEELLSRGTVSTNQGETVEPNAGMAEPIIGEPKEPENAAKQLTADPGQGE